MEAPNGTGSPDLPTGRWLVRRSPGRADSLSAGCDAVLLGSIILYWQSALLRAVGEAAVAEFKKLAEIEREGARG